MKIKFIALLVGTVLMMATSAMATPVYGTINFYGAVAYTGTDTNNDGAISAMEATGVKFLRAGGAPTTPLTTGAYEWVNAVTGAYEAIPNPANNDVAVFFKNFTFAPVLIPNPITVWSLTESGITYDFNMTSVTSSANQNQLLLNGSGLLRITGYDDTIGSWSLSSDGSGSRLSFSSASEVPEPSTMVLLGAGLLGLAIYGKRRMNKTV